MTNYNQQPKHYPILSAAEFIAQGTTPGQIASIARRNPIHARAIRAIAEEVAAITGAPLYGKPRPKAQRHHNDNSRNRGRRAA